MSTHNQIYNWKRLWRPVPDDRELSDHISPHGTDPKWVRPNDFSAVPFESIAEIPCLVLLGEPGMGKTYTMKAEQEAIKEEVEGHGNEIFSLDLDSTGSVDRLVHKLFESGEFTSWVNGKHQLHVFLDDFDKCRTEIRNLPKLLINELAECPVDRLYLRIACRAADWPGFLEEELRQLWGAGLVGVYELMPLREQDVIEAAEANCLDAGVFMSEIQRANAMPLATKPITLNFLLNTYQRYGTLPSTQTELYLAGCRILCEEPDESLRYAKRAITLSAEQRLAVAARIAAVAVFGNRYAVWTDIDLANVPEEDLTIADLCGGSEAVNGDKFRVDEAAVKKTLATGLFSFRGRNRPGWAHQTYAEFLAAHYLIQRQMTVDQIMSLVIHPGDAEEKLVPQLHETAAWLASMKPDIFRKIMDIDAQVLLRSDVATADIRDRAALVESLLNLSTEEKLMQRDLRGWYGKLAHPDLANQLRAYICDSFKKPDARELAIDIVEACELLELQDELADLALDVDENLQVRIAASHVIARIAGDRTKARLKPLAMGQGGDDADDELRGTGLIAVWPDHITAEEMFATLTPPKHWNSYNSYTIFLNQDFAQSIKPFDMKYALEWVEKDRPRTGPSSTYDDAVASVILKACQYLDHPYVLKAFARAIVSQLKHFYRVVKDNSGQQVQKMLSSDKDKRRQVLKAMAPMFSDPENSIWLVHLGGIPMATGEDIPWMLTQLRESSSEKTQRVWALLISYLFVGAREYMDDILIARNENSVLCEVFLKFFGPIELDSEEAEQMKATSAKEQKLLQKIKKTREDQHVLQPQPPIKERIMTLLNEVESGDLFAWCQLSIEMATEPGSMPNMHLLQSDLVNRPAWKDIDDPIRRRVVLAAARYVLEGEPDTHTWLGTNGYCLPAFAGYKALQLLFQVVPGFLPSIQSHIWKKWAPIILTYRASSVTGGEEPQLELLKIAYGHAPDEIIEALLATIDQEDKERGSISVVRKLKDCWDEHLAEVLLDKLEKQELKPDSVFCLLSALLDHKISEARSFAEKFLSSAHYCYCDRHEWPVAISAARALIFHTEDAGWSVIWPIIDQNVEFGRELLEGVEVYPGYGEGVNQKLTEDQLAKLYVWVVRQYPSTEDPKHEEAYWVGPRESVANWRDSILSHLQQRGTESSCRAIRQITRELPELPWIKRTLRQAQNITRYRTWKPLSPDAVLKMSSDSQARLVQSGDQLLDVLIDSLTRLQEYLQGETPAVEDLWNNIPKSINKSENDVWMPKNENSFSNYVKRWLEKNISGIIVNREVEIREGELTDIYVNAVVLDSHGEFDDFVSTIIEVKGCWHRELFTAMKTQLVDRYLEDNQCRYGLYLVGWFNCDKWDNDNQRRRRAPRIGIEEAKKRLVAQATELSQQDMQIRAIVINTALR